MLRNLSILVFMFLMLISYGQKSTLLQNINFRAKELKHSLNQSGDSLILASNKIIYSVEIFNQDFEKTVEVGAKDIRIPLHGTPLGRLVVQAKMPDKRIIMTLLRHETINDVTIKKHKIRLKVMDISNINIQPKFNIRPKAIIKKLEAPITYLHQQKLPKETLVENTEYALLEADNVSKANNRARPSLSSMLNWKPKRANNSNKTFWISNIINSGTTSRKIMKMVNHNEADKIILKYKAEKKTKQGKLNQLTIWEIYDTTKFMERQVENPDYIFSRTSDFFDVTPYFTSKRNLIALN
ncbi:hypothetical protein [uncultured Winogradskyella sp.]|uniref:hypothetical protein n=1 Tax=uncultured Winogradskyella sp. TaxID=395353 RepID=UPI0026083461|nr:hypothetical protein [uncultured Winogradskyella sp.]